MSKLESQPDDSQLVNSIRTALPMITRLAHRHWRASDEAVPLEELLRLGAHVYGELLEIPPEPARFAEVLEMLLQYTMRRYVERGRTPHGASRAAS